MSTALDVSRVLARVPAGARYIPPADDFTALREVHEKRASRGLLRVAFQFVTFRIRGPMRDVHHRAITVRPSRYAEYRVWCFTGDEQVPGVWVWTLDDERNDP